MNAVLAKVQKPLPRRVWSLSAVLLLAIREALSLRPPFPPFLAAPSCASFYVVAAYAGGLVSNESALERSQKKAREDNKKVGASSSTSGDFRTDG